MHHLLNYLIQSIGPLFELFMTKKRKKITFRLGYRKAIFGLYRLTSRQT